MAAALSALNAKIRSQPVLNYVCSTRMSLNALTASKTQEISVLTFTRFLGPSLQFRYTDRSGHGRPKRSGDVSILSHPCAIWPWTLCLLQYAPDFRGLHVLTAFNSQYFRQDDRGPHTLLRHLYALLHGCHAKELSLVRMSLC